MTKTELMTKIIISLRSVIDLCTYCPGGMLKFGLTNLIFDVSQL